MINLGNSSKKQYIWEFMINGDPQKIELYDSKLSGKKKVIKNGMIECEFYENKRSSHCNLVTASFYLS